MSPTDADKRQPTRVPAPEPVDPRSTPVAQVMSSVVVAIRADCHIGVAVDRFVGTGVRQLVVVDTEGRPAGLVSHERVGAAWLEPRETRPTRVDQLVDATGISVLPHTSVGSAAQLMVRHDVHAVPVVDPSGVLVGVVTHTDLVRLLAEQP